VEIATPTEMRVYVATLPDKLCSETTHAFNHGNGHMKQINNAETFAALYKYMSCHSVPFSILESEFSESVSRRFQYIMIRSVMASVASCLNFFVSPVSVCVTHSTQADYLKLSTA
jgi:hypothetical protein